jgi:hypothetical protein
VLLADGAATPSIPAGTLGTATLLAKARLRRRARASAAR